MAGPWREVLEQVLGGQDLDEAQAGALMRALADGALPEAQAGGLLCALRAKGETAAEIRGFAAVMRELALRPSLPGGGPTVDTVGTGGDGSGSFNLSTGGGLLAAACGVRVVKHGNRSISSRSGSADVLECLGLRMPLGPDDAGACLAATGFTFLFAPAYHPAMRNIMPVRSALGVRTVFNVLGPLTNPAAPDYQLIGAYSLEMARLMAEALSGLPLKRAFVVHGEPGWDEATPAGCYELFDVRPGAVRHERRDPRDVGLGRCAPEALAGGDAEANAAALRAVFAGEDRGPHRDALVLNAGLVLELMGETADLGEGIAAAAAAIDDGRAIDLLARIAAFGQARA